MRRNKEQEQAWTRGFAAFALLILGVGLLLAFTAYRQVSSWQEAKLEAQLDRQARISQHRVQRELDHYMGVTRSVINLFDASRKVTRSEFRKFVNDPLNRHRAIWALAWVPRVPREQRKSYRKRARREAISGFRFTERGKRGRLESAGGREAYFPVYYLEPMENNHQILGFDLASHSGLHSSLRRARNTGKMAISAQTTLLPGNTDRHSALAISPVFENSEDKDSLLGFALGLFHVKGLLESALGPPQDTGLNMWLLDGDASADRQLLAFHGSGAEDQEVPPAKLLDRPAELEQRLSLNIADSRWDLVARPVPAFLAAQSSWRAPLASGVILAFSLLAAALVMATGHRGRCYQRLAGELQAANQQLEANNRQLRATEDNLRKSEQLFRQLFEQAAIGIIIATSEHDILEVNQKALSILGYSRDELLGSSARSLLHPDDLQKVPLQRNMERMLSGETVDTERRYRTRSRAYIHVLINMARLPHYDQGRASHMVMFQDISERKQAEEALQHKSRELKERVKELDCLYGLSRLMEKPGISWQELMQSAVELIPFGWQYPDITCARLLLEGEAFYSCDFRETEWKQSSDIVVNGNKAGRIEVFYLREAPEYDEGPFLREERELIGNIAERLGQYLEREQAKEALHRSESYYRALFECSGTAMFISNEDTTIALANSDFEELSGYSREEIEGKKSWTEFIPPEDVSWMKEYHYLRRRDPEAAPRQYECRFIDSHGQKQNLLLSVDMIPETNQSIASGVDITERKRAEQRAYSLAYYDKLTGLPNRELFLELLGRAVSRSERFQKHGAVLLVNIVRLRSVNDTLGEQAGNELIREVGRRIWGAIREMDTVARVSGNEFMILAEGIGSGENARRLGVRVLERIEEDLELSHRRIYPEASIGFTLFPRGATDPDSLIKQADMALSGARKSVDRIQQFAGDEEEISREFHLEQDLKSALANEELWLCYQPQIDLQSGKTVGLEALIRWIHPQWGLVSPGEFIPLLERSGMIAPVDAWVVRRVCKQMRSWRDAGFSVRTSANLSARDLANDTILGVVSSALEENRLPADALSVELTETELMENVDRASGILQTLSDWGIRVALDDFGKGYSCMRYLQQLPINLIKIDKEFVAGMTESADSLTLVQTIIAMAHNLGKEVLAEGVETEEQRLMLYDLGCDYGQGFLWSRPKPAEEVVW